MAKSATLTLRELLESKEFLSCSLCDAVFNEPVMLTCLHSFCLQCLAKRLLVQLNGSLDKICEKSPTTSADCADLSVLVSQDTEVVTNGATECTDAPQGVGMASQNENHDICKGQSRTSEIKSHSEDPTKLGKPTSVKHILHQIEDRKPGREDWGPAIWRNNLDDPKHPVKLPRRPKSAASHQVRGKAPDESVQVSAIFPLTESSYSLRSQTWSTPRLSVTCPTCGDTTSLSGHALLQDDEDISLDRDFEANQTRGKRSEPSTTERSHAKRKATIPSVDSQTKKGLHKESSHTASNTSAAFEAEASRRVYTLLYNTLKASLPSNHFLDSLSTIHHHKQVGLVATLSSTNENGSQQVASSEDVTCSYCLCEGQTVPASSLCLECDDQMCEECACAHRKTRVTRNHTVASYESIRLGLFDHDLRAMGHVACSVHKEGRVTSFCCDCLQAVCKQCQTGDHRAHTFKNLAEMSEKCLSQFAKIQESLSRHLPVLAQVIHSLEEQTVKLGSTRDAVVKSICHQTDLLHKMIDDQKIITLARVDSAVARQKEVVAHQLQKTVRDKCALGQTCEFLHHLAYAGRADEIIASYTIVSNFFKRLVNNTASVEDFDFQTCDDGVASGNLRHNTTVNTDSTRDVWGCENRCQQSAVMSGTLLKSSRCDVPLKVRLSCVFTPGPSTETNLGILLGRLDLRQVPLDAHDSPQSQPLVTSLMPALLSPPRVHKTFQANAPTDKRSPFPTGLAISNTLIAIVDRDNAAVKIFQKETGHLLKVITGKLAGCEAKSLVQPFDVVFLDGEGSVLAVSDPGAGTVRVMETLTGRVFTSLEGSLRHPRGLTILPKSGQIVVVDAHLRQLSIHCSKSGKLVRVLRPTLGHSDNTNSDLSKNNGCGIDQKVVRDCKVNISSEKNQTEDADLLHSNPPHSDQCFVSSALVDPHYIALTMSGNLAVTDLASPNLKVVGFKSSRILSQSLDYGTGGEEALRPSGICVDRYGQVLVVDTHNNRIHVALPNGQLTGATLLSMKHTVVKENCGEDKVPTVTATEKVNESILDNLGADVTTEKANGGGKNRANGEESQVMTDIRHSGERIKTSDKVSRPLCLAVDPDTGHLVVAEVGGQIKFIQYF